MSALLPSPEDIEAKARKAVEEAYEEKIQRLRREYERHLAELKEKYQRLPHEFKSRVTG